MSAANFSESEFFGLSGHRKRFIRKAVCYVRAVESVRSSMQATRPFYYILSLTSNRSR